ncbi:hypothetical protein GHT06_010820 [Daphnia sinensis]|uniref:Phosphatidylinositol-3-phosphatase SAC1 n=1 Tax=Daphnia sinensis TaxID=1820382 RepID=A0AAD5KYX6_9CRUS|nr:hypothetical protein GHT06_010820 [Daphnia sinensis]
MDVYDNLILYETNDQFLFEPIHDPGNILVIDRLNQEYSFSNGKTHFPSTSKSRSIFGIVGTIRLLAGPYLVVITKRSKAGMVHGQDIWKIEETEILPFAKTILHLNGEQLAENKLFKSMIEHVLNIPHFYFSYTFDLTHSLQRLHKMTPESSQIPLHERADKRFVWNHHLIRDFVGQPQMAKFVLPVMLGFVQTHHCTLNRKKFQYTIISRRCCYRAGTRYFMRGVDQEGQVANYVETEQIVEYQGDKCSFIQTRGSIPIFWSQLPNLKPTIPKAVQGANHLEGLTRHLDFQILNYGKQVILNLINQTGEEGKLEKAFSDVINSFRSPIVKYEAFDFHHECRGMRYDRLGILLDRVGAEQEEYAYFMLLRDGTVVQQQNGVFRTNCIDCLDRTNVLQSLLARKNLQQVFLKLGILSEGQTVEDQQDFENLFKNIWADHADVISIQYSGSGALKTDFTRLGKRTQYGLLRDRLNSLVRLYKNHFSDGFRQDAIDLFLGNYVVEQNRLILRIDRSWKYILLPGILCTATTMAFVALPFPNELSITGILYPLFWSGIAAVAWNLIVDSGPEFIDWPKLVCRHRPLSTA